MRRSIAIMRLKIAGIIVTLTLGILVVMSFAADAQRSGKVYRLGFISSSVTSESHPFLEGLRQGLSELGYKAGKNIKIEYRFGKKQELPRLAEDLVKLQVDLIVAGGSQGIKAAKKATQTTPIVMTNSGNAQRSGFVASLARPGGNITGMTQISPELAAKRLQLLQETVPGLSKVAVLWYPLHPNTPNTFKETQEASQKLGLQLISLEVKAPTDFDAAFSTALKQRAEGLVVLREPFMVRHRTLIVKFAMEHQLPAIYETRDFIEAGGLMLYGPSFFDLYRRSATYIDKILRGANPGDLPVERPLKFTFVINLKTAKAIGLTIPPSLLYQADEVIR